MNSFLFADKPDVIVLTKNATSTDDLVDLRCVPNGVPDNYTYTLWEHTWPGHAPVLRSFSGSEVLRLENLTHGYSGFYTCRVENGARYSRNPNAGVGSAYLQVQGSGHKNCVTLLIPSHKSSNNPFGQNTKA